MFGKTKPIPIPHFIFKHSRYMISFHCEYDRLEILGILNLHSKIICMYDIYDI